MALRAIFSSHLTVIDNVEVCMNTVDSFNAVTDYHAVKKYVYWLINTRDQEKRDLESMREKHYWYNQTAYNFSNFHCCEDRNCVGLYRTEAELDANGSKLKEKFKNMLAIDKALHKLQGELKPPQPAFNKGFSNESKINQVGSTWT